MQQNIGNLDYPEEFAMYDYWNLKGEWTGGRAVSSDMLKIVYWHMLRLLF